MGFLGFGKEKPSQELHVTRDIEELDTFLGEIKDWYFKLERLREQLQRLKSYQGKTKGKLANQLREAIGTIEKEIADEAEREKKGEQKRQKWEIQKEKVSDSEEAWIERKNRSLLAAVDHTKSLCNREIIDAVARRVPLSLLDLSEVFFGKDKNIHEIAVAHDIVNHILYSIYRFYFPRVHYDFQTDVEAKVETENPDPADSPKFAEAKNTTRNLLAQVETAKNLCNREIMDAVARRIPVSILTFVEKLLMRARTKEGHDAVHFVANAIVDTIHKWYFPKIGR
ncbi:MAG: hypothetical protein QF798_00460 [Candidatus Woesearchaeota archaeon]|jgi:hypothetical protein|nr:hypothetical protein [Candidatus Woesearchaeota archaeon]|tara:strand:+ start:102 stop:950 length:849 start_codon:yes stop_codon:yes gene_type:complete